MKLNKGIANLPKKNEVISGDSYWLSEYSPYLISLIDGLGSGPKAARASNQAVEIIKNIADLSLENILEQLHNSLRQTRGAVVSLLRLDYKSKKVEYAGIGNIEVKMVFDKTVKTYPNQAGIVGSNLPSKIYVTKTELNENATFILYSDGIAINNSKLLELLNKLKPQQTADKLCNSYRKENDDSTVIIVTKGGNESGI